jgi:hypothetical protein
MAITMYKRLKMYNDMIRLVKHYHSELLQVRDLQGFDSTLTMEYDHAHMSLKGKGKGCV